MSASWSVYTWRADVPGRRADRLQKAARYCRDLCLRAGSCDSGTDLSARPSQLLLTTRDMPASLGHVRRPGTSALHRSWPILRQILQTHCYATVTLPTTSGTTWTLRRPGQPEAAHRRIYEHLGIDPSSLPTTLTPIHRNP